MRLADEDTCCERVQAYKHSKNACVGWFLLIIQSVIALKLIFPSGFHVINCKKST